MVFGNAVPRNWIEFDGEPMEFEWKNFPGITTLEFLTEIRKLMAELKCEPEQFQGRIIFMSMYNEMILELKEMKKIVQRILSTLQTVSVLHGSEPDRHST